jgi:hypothetical protein
MAMKLDKIQDVNTTPAYKSLIDMSDGEIGFIEKKKLYVMRININNESIWLILGDDEGYDYFDIVASEYHEARELYQGESITITFK